MSTQHQIPKERFEIVLERYERYIEDLNDPNKEPIRVFDPLTPKQLQELELIREVSRELQAKKDEEAKKAAQAKEEENVAAEKVQKTEEEVKETEETKKE